MGECLLLPWQSRELRGKNSARLSRDFSRRSSPSVSILVERVLRRESSARENSARVSTQFPIRTHLNQESSAAREFLVSAHFSRESSAASIHLSQKKSAKIVIGKLISRSNGKIDCLYDLVNCSQSQSANNGGAVGEVGGVTAPSKKPAPRYSRWRDIENRKISAFGKKYPRKRREE